jgi:hypothetical protein
MEQTYRHVLDVKSESVFIAQAKLLIAQYILQQKLANPSLQTADDAKTRRLVSAESILLMEEALGDLIRHVDLHEAVPLQFMP